MSNRWIFFPAPAGGETILDVFTLAANEWIWRSNNSWWNNMAGGTWSSTSSATGSYLTIDSSSQIRTSYIKFGSAGSGIPSNARMRLTVTPSAGGTKTMLEGAPAGSGAARFYWVDSGGSTITFTTAQIEEGGTFGWNGSDSITLELFTP